MVVHLQGLVFSFFSVGVHSASLSLTFRTGSIRTEQELIRLLVYFLKSIVRDLPDGPDDPVGVGHEGHFQRVGERRIEAAHPHDGSLEEVHTSLRDERGQLGTITSGPGRLVEDDHTAGPFEGAHHSVDVQRQDVLPGQEAC